MFYNFSSDHNKLVQQTIIKEIISQPNCTTSEKDIRSMFCISHNTCINLLQLVSISVAVRRCYENIRMAYLEHQSGKENYVEDQSK